MDEGPGDELQIRIKDKDLNLWDKNIFNIKVI